MWSPAIYLFRFVPFSPFFSCSVIMMMGFFFLFSLCSFLPFSFSSLKHSSSFILLSWHFWMSLLWMSRLKDCYPPLHCLSHHRPFKTLQGNQKTVRERGGRRGRPTSRCCDPPRNSCERNLFTYLFLNGSWGREVLFSVFKCDAERHVTNLLRGWIIQNVVLTTEV